MSLKQIIKGYTNKTLSDVGVLSSELKDLGVQRLNICNTCDTYNSDTMKCDSTKGGCGCYMKAKVLIKKAKCPKDKW